MPILDISELSIYQRIAGKGAQLRELGLSDVVIAHRLGEVLRSSRRGTPPAASPPRG